MAEKSEQIEENLVKKTCRELGITQKELAEKTKFSETVISRWSKGSKISESAKNHFNLLRENSKLKKHFIDEIIK
jgi:predicted transcriptional regulator